MPGQINKETQTNPSAPLQNENHKPQNEADRKSSSAIEGKEEKSIRQNVDHKQDEEGQEEGGPR